MKNVFIEYIDTIPPYKNAISDDNEFITYGDLRARAKSCASYLQERYGQKNYLLLEAQSNIDYVITLLGIMYSGNTPIPISPNTPLDILDKYKDKSRSAAITKPINIDSYKKYGPINSPHPDIPALVMFTSGTSGDPKGVIMSHNNLIHSCQTIAEYLNYNKHKSAAVILPMHYSYGLLSQVLCQLMIGGFVRLFSNFRNILQFQSTVNDLHLSTFCGVPSTYIALTKINKLQKIHMPSIQILCSAGAEMNLEIFSEIKQIFPNSTFFNNYGMTEACPRISYINENDPHFFEATCGKPIKGVEVKVVDTIDHRIKPPGETGMLVVKGPNITQGYLNDPKKTKEAFTSDGYLITGDLAYIKDDYIYITGRHDDMFNVGGEKVSPIRIEQELNKIPEVLVSGVVGVNDYLRGKLPAAFLMLHDEITRTQINKQLTKSLHSWEIPEYYYSVTELPMTPNGKIQRRLLDPNATYVIKEIK